MFHIHLHLLAGRGLAGLGRRARARGPEHVRLQPRRSRPETRYKTGLEHWRYTSAAQQLCQTRITGTPPQRAPALRTLHEHAAHAGASRSLNVVQTGCRRPSPTPPAVTPTSSAPPRRCSGAASGSRARTKKSPPRSPSARSAPERTPGSDASWRSVPATSREPPAPVTPGPRRHTERSAGRPPTRRRSRSHIASSCWPVPPISSMTRLI